MKAETEGERSSTENGLLRQVMVQMRRERRLLNRKQTFYVRVDRAMGGVFAQLWFLTRGCTWDRRGSCTMCNYGQSDAITTDEMVSFVRKGLDSIDSPVDELYVSPSGSLLDTTEVPADARLAIYRLVDKFPVERFSFETRAETISAPVVDELVGSLPDKQIAVGFGLESADPWVARFCLNKDDQTRAFIRATGQLTQRAVGVYANVSLGSAFLSPGEAIEDSARTVEWSLSNGADLALVFPMHVKPNTLLAWLQQHNAYRPPSLWSLVEVLRSVDRRLIPRVNISWYRADYGADAGVIGSPTTCPDCEQTVMDRLDSYRADPSQQALDALAALDCACKQQWSEEMLAKPRASRSERLFSRYQDLVHAFGLQEWWEDHCEPVRIELEEFSPKASDGITQSR